MICNQFLRLKQVIYNYFLVAKLIANNIFSFNVMLHANFHSIFNLQKFIFHACKLNNPKIQIIDFLMYMFTNFVSAW